MKIRIVKFFTIQLDLDLRHIRSVIDFLKNHTILLLIITLSVISVLSFIYYYIIELGFLYNDARSHLDIGRRVVENLKPGFAQLGSVWLPLPHLLMIPTIWNDFMWHSGLSGAIQSMISYVGTSLFIYLLLRELKIDLFGRLIGVGVFAFNLNILYIQSTAMTELLLLATMTAAVYELIVWYKDENLLRLLRIGFWVLLSTLIRYDGWFLFLFITVIIFSHIFYKYGYKKAEGTVILFATFAGFGILLWFLWNFMIFKDPMYFVFGPYSANAQQKAMEAAGALPTKYNLYISFITYMYAFIYNSNPFFIFIAFIGACIMWFDKRIKSGVRIASVTLFVPLFFNIFALYFGHSSLYVKDIMGSWFNVRYGLVMIPTMAIFIGYFVHKIKSMRYLFLGLFFFITFFSYVNAEAVSLDDAISGSSGKNVKEVSGWLKKNAKEAEGFVLISVASHDAIIFSSGMQMSRFIHEGTGDYWDMATAHPSSWARWIIMRTYDEGDSTFRSLRYNKEFVNNYKLIYKYPFADIYEIKEQYLSQLNLQPVSYMNR
ncbi:hypothetical protein KJ980_05980 [Patescibacteria group bacterium]|nr:hypothetical protein [Patescibacteria group bacterium]MBU4015986.1 hypothetical protein [Patescibacteria group bacterium]MBU4099169.1 hypothetical protein [Patescibacteria group bacterium]